MSLKEQHKKVEFYIRLDNTEYYETTVQLKIMTILFYFYPVKEKKFLLNGELGECPKLKVEATRK